MTKNEQSTLTDEKVRIILQRYMPLAYSANLIGFRSKPLRRSFITRLGGM